MVYELDNISKYNLHPDLEDMVKIGALGKDKAVTDDLIGTAIRINKELYEDSLTGAYNVKHFESSLKKNISLADRQGIPFSILMVDIDHFKFYNDTFGHENGNKVLKEIVGVFKKILREEDTIIRYGGEEFLIILPDTPKLLNVEYVLNKGKLVPNKKTIKIQEPNLVKVTGNRLVEGVRNYFSNVDDYCMMNVTISAGGAIYPIEAVDRDQLVTLADARLYMAKKNGRNRAVF